MSPFEQAFAVVVDHEGPGDRDPNDPGNWTGGRVGSGTLGGTRFGISTAAYPTIDVMSLSLADAQAIYRRDYWEAVDGDALPPPLALLVFDAAVNAGVRAAGQWLQLATGATVDGKIGPLTRAAVAATVAREGGAAVCAEFQARRTVFMAGLPTWSHFGLGWARRLCALPYQTLQMTTGVA